MTFRSGQKVICIDAHCEPDNAIITFLGWVFRRDWPIEGQVYTVKAIKATWLIGEGIELFELKGSTLTSGCFNPARFRAVTARGTDISVFTQILRGTQTSTSRVAMRQSSRQLIE